MNREVGVYPGEVISLKIIPLEEEPVRGEVSQLSRTGLLYLAKNFGREIYNSELGSDNEFGNTKTERHAADPVIVSLRKDRVTTRQVRDVLINIAQGYSTPGLSTGQDKRAWANRFTINLKQFADQVLGEPDLEENDPAPLASASE